MYRRHTDTVIIFIARQEKWKDILFNTQQKGTYHVHAFNHNQPQSLIYSLFVFLTRLYNTGGKCIL